MQSNLHISMQSIIYATLALLFLASIGEAALGIDLSQAYSVADFQCIKRKGYSFAIPRGYQSLGRVDPNVLGNLKRAKQAGFAVGTYLFPKFSKSPEQQMQEMYNALKSGGFQNIMIWIDVEDGSGWSRSSSANINFLSKMIAHADKIGASVGIYAKKRDWARIMGGTTRFKNRPIWYAHWSGGASLASWSGNSFGGGKAFIKQYAGDTKVPGCRMSVDLNYSQLPYAEIRDPMKKKQPGPAPKPKPKPKPDPKTKPAEFEDPPVTVDDPIPEPDPVNDPPVDEEPEVEPMPEPETRKTEPETPQTKIRPNPTNPDIPIRPTEDRKPVPKPRKPQIAPVPEPEPQAEPEPEPQQSDPNAETPLETDTTSSDSQPSNDGFSDDGADLPSKPRFNLPKFSTPKFGLPNIKVPNIKLPQLPFGKKPSSTASTSVRATPKKPVAAVPRKPMFTESDTSNLPVLNGPM